MCLNCYVYNFYLPWQLDLIDICEMLYTDAGIITAYYFDLLFSFKRWWLLVEMSLGRIDLCIKDTSGKVSSKVIVI